MDDQNKNLLIATGLSFVVILIWFVLFPPPEEPAQDQADPAAITQTEGQPATTPSTAPGSASGDTASPAPDTAATDTPRVPIDTPRLEGSIALAGGRIDALTLKDYTVDIDEDSPNVEILEPVGTGHAYYTLFGWAPGSGLSASDVPGPNTEWQVAEGDTLTSDSPVTLSWESPAGLVFRRTVSVDEDFMFTVTQSVENTGESEISAAPYGIIARHGEPVDLKNFFVLHEGVVAMADGKLNEIDYSDMPDMDMLPSEGARAEVTQVSETGWIGFTDHYWMTTLIPGDTGFKQVSKYDDSRDIYQTEAVMPTMSLAPGESREVTTQVFAGAKEYETIRDYQQQGVDRFIDSIDWGWFFFLTKPIFWLLHQLHQLIGNMGWSIIALTVILKAILFPLAFKSYVSMAKMKELQPEMEKLKERAGDDRQKLQQEMMALYKKEKVNPASGCLPILLQIPIFFSLYKVIFVAFELRQAPWFGPFQDLSTPDPTSIYNLFGLLPWAAPDPGSTLALVFVGILPILLGISMFLQQKLNPAPADPTQKMIFAWMPWVFMFMLGGFASGLVVYWITNNTITFTQQYLIMRSQGYKPDVFGNIRSGFKRTPKDDKPAK
ncbi:MAG: membrane protein insertase YidC [Rhodobacteraceae bacterium]|jgi:YidC/Oxa1 family membrane protein insertase|uniref:Membrane protein insertase YidC n=1 Tax=Salipiger profundus TaxID=1229727 RepID=A0A1U7D4Z8_9RHOB|nr:MULTISPECIES: membrane protein insertase YidC [Salipiger]APX23244.1 protein translocase subunit yidC [Salipiger profundus]MAB04861.1 membrane protein insertase YidC [Paracoccaceae bacterium]GGA14233.1 membrane protein insertase YidC [Salipiger profundus]SFD49532.1 protein translocase subunit yidC [Salipiger profundus]